MDASNVNTFLGHFLALAGSGFGLIAGDVNFVLNALIVISIVLSGIKWALGYDNPVAPMFRKVLFIGFFAFLVNNWDALVGAVHRSTAMLGLQAGGAMLTLEDLHNPARVAEIGITLYGRTIELSEGMNIFTDALTMGAVFLAALFVAFGFFVLALQLFVALIAFKLGALAAFVALPWGVFAGTAWVAERPLGWVAGSAMRLFVLAFIASVSIAFVETLPTSLVLEDGGALNILLFGFTMAALSWFGPALASEVVQGQPNLSAADAVHAGAGAALTGAGAGFVAYQGAKALVRGARSLAGRAPPASNPARASVNYAAMRPASPSKGTRP